MSTPHTPHTPLTFDAPYAILNLDWMTALITAIENTPQGQAFTSNCKHWNDAVHDMEDRPPTIFTSLSFNPNQPEVQPGSPFAKLIAPYGEFTAGSHRVQIDKRFQIDKSDIVLQKTRWSATAGNPLEPILRAKGIRSVVVSGLSLSGVVMITVYRLFDLDYNVYVIRDNVLELPVEQTTEVAHVMVDILLPKMGISVISLEEAIEALGRSWRLWCPRQTNGLSG
ncbi:Isochorismatase-like protein [Aspergillus similis]